MFQTDKRVFHSGMLGVQYVCTYQRLWIGVALQEATFMSGAVEKCIFVTVCSAKRVNAKKLLH